MLRDQRGNLISVLSKRWWNGRSGSRHGHGVLHFCLGVEKALIAWNRYDIDILDWYCIHVTDAWAHACILPTLDVESWSCASYETLDYHDYEIEGDETGSLVKCRHDIEIVVSEWRIKGEFSFWWRNFRKFSTPGPPLSRQEDHYTRLLNTRGTSCTVQPATYVVQVAPPNFPKTTWLRPRLCSRWVVKCCHPNSF